MRTTLHRLHAIGLLAILLATAGARLSAHEISFDRSKVRTDGTVTLTIVLEGNFISVDHVKLPLENLTLIAGPSSATEFRWVNGTTSRRRVLTYRLLPKGAGTASVGPVVISAPNGDQLTLKRVTVEVIDPVRSDAPLDGELSLGRLPAVVAEVSKREAWVGEQIEVRWSLYGENIRGVQLLELPAMDGFWVEQLDSDETVREILRIGDELVQRQTLRHVLLYPLREGTYDIEPLVASVRVYRRDPFGDVGGWGPFGGNVTELTRRSETVTVQVSSPGVSGLPVGSFDLSCSDPRVPKYGPVAIDLKLSGAANLRAVPPPRFSGEIDAGVELESLATSLAESNDQIVMQRGWRYLLFPERKGNLVIPPLGFRFFDPATEEVRTARCGGWTVPVAVANAESSAGTSEPSTRVEAGEPSAIEAYWIPVTVSLATLLLMIPLLLHIRRRDPGAARLLRHVDRPADLRRELESWLVRRGRHPVRLMKETGAIADAWRSVRSLLDLVEREPWELERSRPELRRRIRELIDELA